MLTFGTTMRVISTWAFLIGAFDTSLVSRKSLCDVSLLKVDEGDRIYCCFLMESHQFVFFLIIGRDFFLCVYRLVIN